MQQKRPLPFWGFVAAATAGLLAFGSRSPRPAHARARARDGEGREGRSPLPADRGHEADTPSEIPARGWWAILKRVVKEASADRLLTEAAGVTFYTLLAIFPAIAALVSIYGIVADRATIADHLATLAGVIPGGGMQLIEEQVKRLVEAPSASLGIGAVFGILVSIWSANQATKGMFDALNVIYEEEEKRGFIKLTLTSLLFTFCGILFAVSALAAVVVLPVVLDFVGLGQGLEWLLHLARWPLLLLGVGLVLAALYRWGPSRANAKWRWVTWGSGVASALWLIASLGFSWYVENFGSYNETYGSLGAAIGFMTWIWISAAVVLLGGELNAEMEHQTARDTTTGPSQPMGTRGATMADRVAAE